jgi:hypothetical protein
MLERVLKLGARELQLGLRRCCFVGQWSEHDVAEVLPGVDVAVISAHVEVNRIWEPAIDEGLKRWAFQRRFRSFSQHAGAALAHARGTDDSYVRNCDDWSAHRGKEPFPGPRVGEPIGTPRSSTTSTRRS